MKILTNTELNAVAGGAMGFGIALAYGANNLDYYSSQKAVMAIDGLSYFGAISYTVATAPGIASTPVVVAAMAVGVASSMAIGAMSHYVGYNVGRCFAGPVEPVAA
jgi:hypothetical protein